MDEVGNIVVNRWNTYLDFPSIFFFFFKSQSNICLYVVAKPIDLLARYINAEDDEDSAAVELHEPYTYLNVSIHMTVSIKIFPILVHQQYKSTLLALFNRQVTIM